MKLCRLTCKIFVKKLNYFRNPSYSSRVGKAISENEIVASLPADASGKTSRLYDLAMDSISNFFSSHNLEVKFPEETTIEIARAIEEGNELRNKTKILTFTMLTKCLIDRPWKN